MAPIFLNHPLIDKIRITDNWDGFGENDRKLMAECDVVVDTENYKHPQKNWYNYTGFIEETAILAGITDITEVLTPDELKPKLIKWFDPGFDNPHNHTYSKTNARNLVEFDRNIAIWPFAQADNHLGRSPSTMWWNQFIEKLTKQNYTVYHYGKKTDPNLSDLPGYKNLTYLSFFDQIKACLASKLVIGPNTGPMFVVGAYSHPSLHLLTNYYHDHNENFLTLAPVNDNGTNLFIPRNPRGLDAMIPEKVVEHVNKKIEESSKENISETTNNI